MSKIHPVALYQIETFGSRAGAFQRESGARARRRATPAGSGDPARRSGAFLVQVMLGGDGDLRWALGRADLAESREQAYGGALANRPSAKPLGFLHVIGDA
jgi:hypothetical protein